MWDPEKWHASLYPSECDLPGEGYKRDYAEDRPPLKRRIAGNLMHSHYIKYVSKMEFRSLIVLFYSSRPTRAN